MVEFGNGFNWTEVYFTMPTHIRRFYFGKLVEFKKREAEQSKKAQTGSKPSKVRIR